jgi:hypothetical protein
MMATATKNPKVGFRSWLMTGFYWGRLRREDQIAVSGARLQVSKDKFTALPCQIRNPKSKIRNRPLLSIPCKAIRLLRSVPDGSIIPRMVLPFVPQVSRRVRSGGKMHASTGAF